MVLWSYINRGGKKVTRGGAFRGKIRKKKVNFWNPGP